MPELPDVYAESLSAKVAGSTLQRIRIANPFVQRTALPPIGAAEGRAVRCTFSGIGNACSGRPGHAICRSSG